MEARGPVEQPSPNTHPPAALRPGGRLADRPAGDATTSKTNPEGDAGRRETSGSLVEALPVSRRPAGGRPPYHKRPSVRFCVTVAPPASTPDPRAWCSPARRPVRGEDASARAGFDGLVRTRPRIGPGSGCSWAPTRDGLRPHPELALCRAQRPGRWRPGHRRGNRPTSQRASPAGHRKRSPGWSGRWVAGVVGFFCYYVNMFSQNLRSHLLNHFGFEGAAICMIYHSHL
ncbi:hypothetical protein CHKEEEPN_4148 [Methylorubrum podarium]|nr:hypothetical protein CHKEEEPN_4148 [Methylorubrum podarium]